MASIPKKEAGSYGDSTFTSVSSVYLHFMLPPLILNAHGIYWSIIHRWCLPRCSAFNLWMNLAMIYCFRTPMWYGTKTHWSTSTTKLFQSLIFTFRTMDRGRSVMPHTGKRQLISKCAKCLCSLELDYFWLRIYAPNKYLHLLLTAPILVSILYDPMTKLGIYFDICCTQLTWFQHGTHTSKPSLPCWQNTTLSLHYEWKSSRNNRNNFREGYIIIANQMLWRKLLMIHLMLSSFICRGRKTNMISLNSSSKWLIGIWMIYVLGKRHMI